MIKHRIQEAKSDKEIENALAEGATYKYASEHTKRDWQKAATKRRNALVRGAEGKKLRQSLQSPATATK